MKALVVYESLFGNTATIGEAIAASLASRGIEVESGPISRIDPSRAAGADLLVVGAPTHAHGMSRVATRKAAVEDERNTFSEPTASRGIRDWMDALPTGAGRLAASFDTRFDKPRALTGSAAKGIWRRLERRGYHLLTTPESFFVTGQHELEAGQTDRAKAWAAAVADRAKAGAAH
jgi:hypothetical protein